MNPSIILALVSAIALAALSVGCGDDHTRDSSEIQPDASTTPSRQAIEQSLDAAESYLQAADFPRAEAILLRLIERAPNEAAAHEMYGQLLLGRAADARQGGDTDEADTLVRSAYERYRLAIKHASPSAGLHQSAGDMAQMAGMDEAALEHYTQAMQLDPTQPRPAIMAAQLLAQQKKFAEAEHILQRALAVDPDEPLIHASLANIALQRGKIDDALEHIREARAIQPEDASLRLVEATIHRHGGHPQRCLELLIGLPREQRAQPAMAREIATCELMLEQANSDAVNTGE